MNSYAPLALVGQIEVPDDVLGHRFVIEAFAAATVLGQSEEQPDERVVGTANTKQVELYGWAENVGTHTDNTGYVYLCALMPGDTLVYVWGENDAPHCLSLPVGAVVLLDDRFKHATIDDGVRVCAFIGSFDTPCDREAVDQIREGVKRLAAGDYYGAPRVQAGFRALGRDECLVPNAAFDACEPHLLADVESHDGFYEGCAHCDNPAIRIDSKWPYFSDDNRCRDHLKLGIERTTNDHHVKE